MKPEVCGAAALVLSDVHLPGGVLGGARSVQPFSIYPSSGPAPGVHWMRTPVAGGLQTSDGTAGSSQGASGRHTQLTASLIGCSVQEDTNKPLKSRGHGGL